MSTRFCRFFFAVVVVLQTPFIWASSNAVVVTAATASNAVFPQTAVGQFSAPQTIQLQLNQAMAIASIGVPQSTGSKQEFSPGTVGGCVLDGTTVNPVGTICTVGVVFHPGFPGLRQQPLVLVDSTGVAYSFGLTGVGTGPQTVLLPGSVTTVSGFGSISASTPLGDGGPASAAAPFAPEGLVIDNSSNVYYADTSHNRVRVIYQGGAGLACLIEVENPALFGLSAGATSCAGAAAAPVAGDMYTIAGNGTAGYAASDGVMATSAELNAPASVAVDAAGNVFIGDVTNFRVRVIYAGGAQAACLIELENGSSFGLGATPTSCAGATSAPVVGFIYSVAGAAGAQAAGFTGDGGLANAAKIAAPYGLALDSAGDVFFSADSSTASIGSHIRVIYEGGANAATLIGLENPGTTPLVGNIYTVMGSATSSVASTGDGGLASAAGMLYAYGLFVDGNGNVYFPDKTSGTAPTVSKMRVVFNSGAALANLIGLENSGITAQPGFVYTIAGNSVVAKTAPLAEGVLATASSLAGTYDAIVDPSGNIYLAERLSETIRKINITTGIIQTIAGQAFVQGIVSGQATNQFGGTAANAAQLWGPWGVAMDSFGGLYFTDNGANRIRNDSAAAGTLTFATTAVPSTSATQAFVANNIGNANLQIATLTAGTDFGVIAPAGIAGISDCSGGSLLAAGASCSVGVNFMPQTGGAITGTATVTDNALNATAANHSAPLSGTGTGTTTTLTTNPASMTYGQSVTLTANVVSAPSTPVTSGSVAFSVNGVNLGTAAVDPATGNTSVTTTLLPGGSPTVMTMYAANGSYTESNASFTLTVAPAPLTLVVNAATKIYGAALPAFSSTSGGALNGDTIGVRYSTTATAASNVGSYTINAALTGASATNYTATVTTAQLTVTTAPLLVTANNLTKVVNAPNPPLTYAVTGFVNSDTSAVLSGAPMLNTTATTSSGTGDYPITITQGTLSAGNNYRLSFVNGVLTVSFVGTQTISFAPIANVTYGVAPFTVNATSSAGLPVTISALSGSNVSLNGNTATLINGTVTVTGAGPVTLQANAAGNASYPAATAVNQTFVVNPAALTVKANNVTYVYGAPTPLTGTVTGTVTAAGDSFTETFATTAPATTPVPVGTYTITPSVTANGATNVANYAIATTSGTLTVGKAGSATGLSTSVANANLGAPVLYTATVTSATTGTPAGTVTFVADGTNTLGTGTLTNGVATLSVSSLAAGSHTIVATYGGDANFNGSANSAITQIVTAPAFTATTSAQGIAISSGKTATVAVTVATVGGYAKTITPKCAAGTLTCSFSPSSLVFSGANNTQTLTVTIGTVATASLRSHAPSGILAALALWFPGSLLGVFALRRKRSWQRLAMLLVMVTGASLMVGCGSSSPPAAPLGTQNLAIILSDGSTSTTVNLTVTVTGNSSIF